MTDIEAKINSKLHEIESMFNDKNIPGAPIIIKGNQSGNNLNAIQNSMESAEGNNEFQENNYKKGAN
jgi:hypothetical protein